MKVNSSNIAAIDYEDGDGLTVTFNNERTYRYPAVPVEIYDELVSEVGSVDPGASVGKAFNRLVRNASFEAVEVTE